MSERKYYCYCDDNCKFETLTKEQIFELISAVIANGEFPESIDTGFVSKVKEINMGRHVTFWLGTQAQYNALTERAENCLYIIADSTKERELAAFKQEVGQEIESANEVARRAYSEATAAKATAADANSKADAALANKMVREFNSGILGDATTYTTKDATTGALYTLSKLYIVQLLYVGANYEIRHYSVAMDWAIIHAWTKDSGNIYYTADSANQVSVKAVVNADNTVTFTAAIGDDGVQRVYIQNVVGYY